MPIGDIRVTAVGKHRIVRANAVSFGECSECCILGLTSGEIIGCSKLISGNNQSTTGPKGADCFDSIWHLTPPEKATKAPKKLDATKKAKRPAARVPVPYAPIGSSKSTKEQLLVSLGKASEEVAKARSAEARIGTRLDRMTMNLKNARAAINRLQKEVK